MTIGKSLDNLFKDHLEWVSKTFPEATAIGALIHAGREIEEVKDDIKNEETLDKKAEELADVIGCIVSAAERTGVTPKMLNKAFRKKLEKNKKRKWKSNGDGSYSHIKEEFIESVPLSIKLVAKLYKLIEIESNEATGTIKKMKFAGGKSTTSIGERVVECTQIDNIDYSIICIQLGDDWFKEIGKWKETRTC